MLKKILNAISHHWDALDLQVWELCYSQPASAVELAQRLSDLGLVVPLLSRLDRMVRTGYLKRTHSDIGTENRGGMPRYRYHALRQAPTLGAIAEPWGKTK